MPVDVKRVVLHESGYKCGNPACRTIITLDIHHLVPVSDDGGDTADNLLPLCPNCHALHHKGVIPLESVRAWKMLLLTLNEAFDRRTIDLLLAIKKVGEVYVSGDGLLSCAAVVAADLVKSMRWGPEIYFQLPIGTQVPKYKLTLTERGSQLIDAWLQGDQRAAIQSCTPAPAGNEVAD